MPKRIVIIQGHPTPGGGRFGHALAEAYAQGAAEGGHEVREVRVAEIDFPLLRAKEDFDKGEVPPALRPAQEAIAWAEHLLILYPLWLGSMPALLKGFFEQVFRPGFATSVVEGGTRWEKKLSGRSARIVVTMGMPAFVYRWFFGAHSLKSLERNVLRFVGIKPIRESLIGLVEASPEKRQRWLATMRELGREGK